MQRRESIKSLAAFLLAPLVALWPGRSAKIKRQVIIDLNDLPEGQWVEVRARVRTTGDGMQLDGHWFGHKKCCGTDPTVTFLVENQGDFTRLEHNPC